MLGRPHGNGHGTSQAQRHWKQGKTWSSCDEEGTMTTMQSSSSAPSPSSFSPAAANDEPTLAQSGETAAQGGLHSSDGALTAARHKRCCLIRSLCHVAFWTCRVAIFPTWEVLILRDSTAREEFEGRRAGKTVDD